MRASRIPPQYRRRRLAFGEPIGDARLRVHDQPVAILHQQVPQIRQARLRVVRLPIQPGVGIRGRRMRVVLPVVSPEVAAIAVGVTAFPLKTLLTCNFLGRTDCERLKIAATLASIRRHRQRLPPL